MLLITYRSNSRKRQRRCHRVASTSSRERCVCSLCVDCCRVRLRSLSDLPESQSACVADLCCRGASCRNEMTSCNECACRLNFPADGLFRYRPRLACKKELIFTTKCCTGRSGPISRSPALVGNYGTDPVLVRIIQTFNIPMYNLCKTDARQSRQRAFSHKHAHYISNDGPT